MSGAQCRCGWLPRLWAFAPAFMALVSGSCTSAPSAAQYPSKPITFVTHSTPGGGGDVFLRELGKYLHGIVPVPIVVENRAGGASATAVSYVAQAQANGYVLYGATPTTLMTSILTRTRHSFQDLQPIANLFFDPMILYVRGDSPWRTLADVVNAAKQRPGQIRWGASAAGTVEHMIAFDMQKLAGIRVQPVTFEGGGDLMVAVLGGHVDLGIGEFGEMTSLLDAGRLRAIASFTGERISGADLPTAREQGIELVTEKFRGVLGPKGLHATVIRYWEDVIQKALATEAYRQQYEGNHLLPAYMDHEEFQGYLARSDQTLRNYMKELGVIQ
ncbi:MAG: tripartite tricarboxylate transporter substrate binding protein [Gemmatimonadetes bacterium]|nr:tripartite tricarboxylate transporter substrate binding protein [Gemmatimonadota bacterium]